MGSSKNSYCKDYSLNIVFKVLFQIYTSYFCHQPIFYNKIRFFVITISILYSQCPKSELVQISDDRLQFGLNRFEMVRISDVRLIHTTEPKPNVRFSKVSTKLDHFRYNCLYKTVQLSAKISNRTAQMSEIRTSEIRTSICSDFGV